MVSFRPCLALIVGAVGSASAETQIEMPRARVDFVDGGLGADEMQAFAGLVDKGIADIEALVLELVPAERRRTGRLRYVVARDVQMSRTYGRTVVLPLERVASRRAPYLHETAHALLPKRHTWPWLSEGFASYLESWVSEHRGGYDAHVFTRAGDRDIHEAARRHLRTEAGQSVLAYVGRDGSPPELETDRWRVARPYYVLSHSLTKFIVDQASLGIVVQLQGEPEPSAALTASTGRGPEAWRHDWLRALRATDAGLGAGSE